MPDNSEWYIEETIYYENGVKLETPKKVVRLATEADRRMYEEVMLCPRMEGMVKVVTYIDQGVHFNPPKVTIRHETEADVCNSFYGEFNPEDIDAEKLGWLRERLEKVRKREGR